MIDFKTHISAFTVRGALVCGALIAASSLGHAALIPSLDPGPLTPSGPNFVFSYQINLQQDERLDPAATMGNTCVTAPSTRVACNPAGTFVTLYDIQNFVSASAPANWGTSIQFTGVTPSNVNGSFDGPGLANVTFMYTGPVVTPAGTTVPFTGFNIVSSLGGFSDGTFSFQATKNTQDDAGLTDQGTGPVTLPGSGSRGTQGNVPEPATLSLAGAALLGLGVLRKYKRA